MPPTLGQRLKHAREKRGFTLRDVEHTTKIPVARLHDLEEDRLNSFGGMTYAKCFLRTYATLLEVNADDVISQMKPPPLGGLRDYRYLVETHGPWVPDKAERHHFTSPPTPALTEGKSFMFAAMVCVAFGLLIGGGVLANAYFNTKPAVKNSLTPAMTGGAHNAKEVDPLAEEQEFSIFGVSLTIVPEKADATARMEATKQPGPAATSPPKAEAVR